MTDAHDGARSDELAETIFPLAEAFRGMFARVDDLWSDEGLNPSEAAVIERLFFYHDGTARSGDLVGNPIRSTPAMGHVLASLERKQLITRRRDDEDRRIVLVEGTVTARSLYTEMVKRIVDRVLEPTTKNLRASDLAQLRRITPRLEPPDWVD